MNFLWQFDSLPRSFEKKKQGLGLGLFCLIFNCMAIDGDRSSIEEKKNEIYFASFPKVS